METIKLETVVGDDGKIRLEIASGLPAGPAEVTILISPKSKESTIGWDSVRGLGKEIWEGEDAQDYVNRLRDEWER